MAIKGSKGITDGIQNMLRKSTDDVTKSLTRLSSGKRINSASDDAAGLAIVSQLETNSRISLQGARNALDGISVGSIAEGGLSQISGIQQRQAELATQAANGTLSDTQRQTLNSEYQQLEQEKGRILSSTEFNGKNVFSQETRLEVDGSSDIVIPSVDTASITDGAADISTQAGAQLAIDSINAQIGNTASFQSQIGAATSRLSVAEGRARSSSIESEAAASRIRDADIAEESAHLTAGKIRQNSGVAILAQANQSHKTVLQLLQ